MVFGANKIPVEVIKEGAFGGNIIETFILVLMVIGTESHGRKLISWKILIKNTIV